MTVLVCGSRHWRDWRTIYRTLDEIGEADQNPQGMPQKITLLLHGGCGHYDAERREVVGADKIADDWATSSWVPVIEFTADWHQGKHAGPRRNAQMLARKPDLVVAFHDDLEGSKGTKDMVAQARRAGIPVRIVASQAGRQEESR